MLASGSALNRVCGSRTRSNQSRWWAKREITWGSDCCRKSQSYTDRFVLSRKRDNWKQIWSLHLSKVNSNIKAWMQQWSDTECSVKKATCMNVTVCDCMWLQCSSWSKVKFYVIWVLSSFSSEFCIWRACTTNQHKRGKVCMHVSDWSAQRLAGCHKSCSRSWTRFECFCRTALLQKNLSFSHSALAITFNDIKLLVIEPKLTHILKLTQYLHTDGSINFPGCSHVYAPIQENIFTH